MPTPKLRCTQFDRLTYQSASFFAMRFLYAFYNVYEKKLEKLCIMCYNNLVKWTSSLNP